jgi:hypothetical protein
VILPKPENRVEVKAKADQVTHDRRRKTEDRRRTKDKATKDDMKDVP